MAQTLEIDQTDGLELIDGQRQLFKLAGRYARGLEQRHSRDAANGSFNRWAGHWSLHWFLAYAHHIRDRPSVQSNAGVRPGSDAPTAPCDDGAVEPGAGFTGAGKAGGESAARLVASIVLLVPPLPLAMATLTASPRPQGENVERTHVHAIAAPRAQGLVDGHEAIDGESTLETRRLARGTASAVVDANGGGNIGDGLRTGRCAHGRRQGLRVLRSAHRVANSQRTMQTAAFREGGGGSGDSGASAATAASGSATAASTCSTAVHVSPASKARSAPDARSPRRACSRGARTGPASRWPFPPPTHSPELPAANL